MPMISRREAELVVGLGVHEHVIVSCRVEVFVFLGLDVRDLDLVDGAEPLVDQRAVVHVPQLGLNHRPEVARRVVGEVEDDEVDALHRDHHPSTDVGRFEHHGCWQFSSLARFIGSLARPRVPFLAPLKCTVNGRFWLVIRGSPL